MSVHQIREKAETAFKTVIANAGVTQEGHTSFESSADTVTLPCYSIQMLNAVEEPFGLGNYRAQFGIEVMSSAVYDASDNPTPQATHAAFVGSVFDALKIDELGAQLSAAVSDFSVMGNPIDRGLDPPEVDGRMFRDAIVIEIYCAPNDFA